MLYSVALSDYPLDFTRLRGRGFSVQGNPVQDEAHPLTARGGGVTIDSLATGGIGVTLEIRDMQTIGVTQRWCSRLPFFWTRDYFPGVPLEARKGLISHVVSKRNVFVLVMGMILY